MVRHKFSERMVIETLAWQRIFVDCFRCNKPFFVEAGDGCLFRALDPEREHLHELALDGKDIPSNCRYSCSECHARITNGTKATSAGSSKQRIAKVRRITGQNKPRPKTKIPPRPFQKGRRPFRRKPKP